MRCAPATRGSTGIQCGSAVANYSTAKIWKKGRRVCFYLLVVAARDVNALKSNSCVCDVGVSKDSCASFDWMQTYHATLFVDTQLHCHWSVHEDVWHLAK